MVNVLIADRLAEAANLLEAQQADRFRVRAYRLGSETVRGFAAVKRVMLQRAHERHLLLGSEKFGRKGLAHVGDLSSLHSIVVDARPTGDLASALVAAKVEVIATD